VLYEIMLRSSQPEGLKFMRSTIKIWTQLGFGTALAGGLLAACSGEAGENAGRFSDSDGVAGSAAGEGEGGGSGEGEGGVDTARAASDPVVYRIALAVTEAHVIAARDAFAAGRKDAAAEMFAHPVAEVLVDMGPVFERQGVADFSDLLTDASGAVFAGETAQQIDARYQAIIAVLRGAGAKAPAADASEGEIAAKVVADQIERAVAMYRQAAAQGEYEAYLDGYGFYKAAEALFMASESAIKAANPQAHQQIGDGLGLLAKAFPGAVMPGRINADQSALAAASARVMLAVGP
jgi:hypothetical protein